MIVTLGATNSESEERFGRHVCHLVHDEFPLHPSVTLVVLVDAKSQKCSRDQNFGIIGRQFVARELFTNKLIVGLVLV